MTFIMDFIHLYGESAKTALGFFWKSGWAFVLSYFVSGMIQAFVPKGKLTQHMGEADIKKVAVTIFIIINVLGLAAFAYTSLLT